MVWQKRANLHYRIGLGHGLEEGKTSLKDYRTNLRRLMAVIEGKKNVIEKEIEKEMLRFAKNEQFEQAAGARTQLFALKRLSNQVIFSDKEFLDISKDHALIELVDILGLKSTPKTIEGYDISHMSGTDVVASMVTFTNGVSNRQQYRKFKTKKDQNNDFDNMNETIQRRFSEKNIKDWGLPSLVLIDGGKGQLDAAIKARDEKGQQNLPFIGLAKREEQMVIRKADNQAKSQKPKAKSFGSQVELNKVAVKKLGGFITETDDYVLINLPHTTNVIKLLQRIRDQSHRFAVSYHSSLKTKRVSKSELDDIPGVGVITRKKLLREFGSLSAVKKASESELTQLVGAKLAHKIFLYLST